jgi:cbb3-type cytochrome oxidase subunit 3
MNKSPGKEKRTKSGFRISRARGPAPAGPEEELKASPPILLSLLNRAFLVVFLLCLLCVSLYALGLKREFTGPSLLALVQTAVYSGIALAILSLYRFIAGLWFFLRRRRPLLLLKGLGFLFLGVLGALLAAAGTFIAVLAKGNV